ncbi:Uncharacterised protein [Streptococcus pneumoniae]|nr:Uncharacterised protein [Streptococcus pneumoniae]CKU84264.1 Uncharacterised protein [Mycobacterium tuberculosis]
MTSRSFAVKKWLRSANKESILSENVLNVLQIHKN